MKWFTSIFTGIFTGIFNWFRRTPATLPRRKKMTHSRGGQGSRKNRRSNQRRRRTGQTSLSEFSENDSLTDWDILEFMENPEETPELTNLETVSKNGDEWEDSLGGGVSSSRMERKFSEEQESQTHPESEAVFQSDKGSRPESAAGETIENPEPLEVTFETTDSLDDDTFQDPWRESHDAVTKSRPENSRQLFLFSNPSEEIGCVLINRRVRSIRPDRLQPFRAKERLYHNRFPAQFSVHPQDFCCQIVWGEEPVVKLPGQTQHCWMDAHRAACLMLLDREELQLDSDEQLTVLLLCENQMTRSDWGSHQFSQSSEFPHPLNSRIYSSPNDFRELLDSLENCTSPVYLVWSPQCRLETHREFLISLGKTLKETVWWHDSWTKFLRDFTHVLASRWESGNDLFPLIQAQQTDLFLPGVFSGAILFEPVGITESATTHSVQIQDFSSAGNVRFSLASAESHGQSAGSLNSLSLPMSQMQDAGTPIDRLALDVCTLTASVRARVVEGIVPTCFPVASDSAGLHSLSPNQPVSLTRGDEQWRNSGQLQVTILFNEDSSAAFLERVVFALDYLSVEINTVLLIHQQRNQTITISVDLEEWNLWRGDHPAAVVSYKLKRLNEVFPTRQQVCTGSDPAVILRETLSENPSTDCRGILLIVDHQFSFPADSIWSEISRTWAWQIQLRRQLGGKFCLLPVLFQSTADNQKDSDLQLESVMEQLMLSAGQIRRLDHLLIRWNDAEWTVAADLDRCCQILREFPKSGSHRRTALQAAELTPSLLRNISAENDPFENPPERQVWNSGKGVEIPQPADPHEMFWLEDGDERSVSELNARLREALTIIEQQQAKRSAWFRKRGRR